MSIIIEPTKIKQSFYLLIPKSIADMVEIDSKTKFSLKIKNENNHKVLEYYFGALKRNEKA